MEVTVASLDVDNVDKAAPNPVTASGNIEIAETTDNVDVINCEA